MDTLKKIAGKLLSDKKFIVMLTALVVLIIIAIIVYNVRYAPSEETMSLDEYYEVQEGELALIVDGELYTDTTELSKGIVSDGTPYIRCDIAGSLVGDVYAYDESGHNVAFTTTEGIYRANVNEFGYTYKGRSTVTEYAPLVESAGGAYLAAEFVALTSGIEYTYDEEPARCAIYTPGLTRTVSTISKDTPLRRFGGNKSKVLSYVSKGDKVSIVDNYGSWSQVLTGDGVLGCVQNRYLRGKDKVSVDAGATSHSLDHAVRKGKIKMGWHQTFSANNNSQLDSILATAGGNMNVISPTWLQIRDNSGNINSFASADYVAKCHDSGIDVWILVSNIENEVDEGLVFGTATARERLINNIISTTTGVGADGINVDMESISEGDVDGFVEFVKELALRCKENNLVLSVDNYNLDSVDYKIGVQKRFADYIVLFGYDETWTGSPSAGSNNSMNYVETSVEGMLDAGVDKNQLILAIPFYTRLWKETAGSLSSEAVFIKDTPKLLSDNGATPVWLKDNKENYAEWTSGDTKYSIWIVDNKSLGERLDYVAKQDIAGVSAWKLGGETADTWRLIGSKIR